MGPLDGERLAPLVPLVVNAVQWLHLHKWLIIGAIIATPAIAMLQGMYFLARYRIQYGEAPVPLLPAHGVVVVNPKDSVQFGQEEDTRTLRDVNIETRHGAADGTTVVPRLYPLGLSGIAKGEQRILGSKSNGGASWIWGSSRELKDVEDRDRIRRAANSPPLRLLMIGDSLAAGVGVLSSCTPILPEAIAKSLSKALGGRTVYWTCVAEAGASSGWIVRELEKFQNDEGGRRAAFTQPLSSRVLSLRDEEAQEPGLDITEMSDGAEERQIGNVDETDIDESNAWKEWCDRLGIHSKRLKSEVFGEYDVAIVMTGLNDLKGIMLPFLLQGDEIEFRRQARQRGGDYTDELKRVVDAVAAKMKVGLRESLLRVRSSVDNIIERMGSTRSPITAETSREDEAEQIPLAKQSEDAENYETMNKDNKKEEGEDGEFPLVVLTALPRNLPILHWPPFIWFMLPLLRMADRFKRKLAERYPNAILYVDAPSAEEMAKFESRTGPVFDQLQREDTLLSLKGAPARSKCRDVELSMQQYFTKHAKRRPAENPMGNLFDGVEFVIHPANARPDAPGASLLAADGIHFNDAGYDFWGRYIAAAICQKWQVGN